VVTAILLYWRAWLQNVPPYRVVRQRATVSCHREDLIIGLVLTQLRRFLAGRR